MPFSLGFWANTVPNIPAPLGDNWTARTGANAATASVAFGNSTYVIAGGFSTSNVQTSSDTISWTSRTVNATYYYGEVSSSGSLFVLSVYSNTGFTVNPNIAYSSSDGITWTQRTLATSTVSRSSAYGLGYFIIPGFYNNINTGSAATSIHYSTDGVNWSSSAVTLKGWDIAFGNSRFVVSNQNSATSFYSTNGTSWTSATMPSTSFWQSVSFGNGLFIMGTSGTGYATSTDGITWTARTFPATPSQSQNGIAWGDTQWVMFPNTASTTYYTSPDGITWTAKTIGTNGSYNAGFANNRLFAMAGTNIQVSG